MGGGNIALLKPKSQSPLLGRVYNETASGYNVEIKP